MYKGFLIDLDGTAYLGDKVINETVDFVKRCRAQDIKILFVTNNASATINTIYNKLTNMGYEIQMEEILTSAIATAKYLKEENSKNIFLIGDNGLKDALNNENIEYETNLNYEKDIKVIRKINNVVVGYTNKLNYQDIACASLVLRNEGSKLISTNGDLIIPTHLGGLPGNGSIVNLLQVVSKKSAITIGKPEDIIMDLAIEVLGLKKEEVCMIGDNYETDILSGINNNIHTIFVNTGVNTKEEVLDKKLQPTYMVDNLNDFNLN